MGEESLFLDILTVVLTVGIGGYLLYGFYALIYQWIQKRKNKE